MSTFITNDFEFGTLLLMDECGNFVYCPKDRFEVCTI